MVQTYLRTTDNIWLCLQELDSVLTDTLFHPCLDLTSSDRPDVAKLPGYWCVGLVPLHIQDLRHMLMGTALSVAMSHEGHSPFWQKPMAHCLGWCSDYVSWKLGRGEHADFTLAPYLSFIGRLHLLRYACVRSAQSELAAIVRVTPLE